MTNSKDDKFEYRIKEYCGLFEIEIKEGRFFDKNLKK